MGPGASAAPNATADATADATTDATTDANTDANSDATADATACSLCQRGPREHGSGTVNFQRPAQPLHHRPDRRGLHHGKLVQVAPAPALVQHVAQGLPRDPKEVGVVDRVGTATQRRHGLHQAGVLISELYAEEGILA